MKRHSYHRVLLHTHIEFCRVVVVHLVNLLAAIRKLFCFLIKLVQTCSHLSKLRSFFWGVWFFGSNFGHVVWANFGGISCFTIHFCKKENLSLILGFLFSMLELILIQLNNEMKMSAISLCD